MKTVKMIEDEIEKMHQNRAMSIDVLIGRYFFGVLPEGGAYQVNGNVVSFYAEGKAYGMEWCNIYLHKNHKTGGVLDMQFTVTSARTAEQKDFDTIIFCGKVAEILKNKFGQLLAELDGIGINYQVRLNGLYDEKEAAKNAPEGESLEPEKCGVLRACYTAYDKKEKPFGSPVSSVVKMGDVDSLKILKILRELAKEGYLNWFSSNEEQYFSITKKGLKVRGFVEGALN